MNSSPDRLRLLGLIQDLQQEAASLGLTRTAAALEVTGAVATEELSDPPAAVSRLDFGQKADFDGDPEDS